MAIRLSRCCCFRARTGALILASLGIFTASVGTLGYSALIPSKDVVLTTYEDVLRKELDRGIIAEGDYDDQMYICDTLRHILPYVLGSGLVTSVFFLAVNAMLLSGIIYNRSYLMLPWLIVEMVFLVLATVCAAVGSFGLMSVSSIGGGFIVLAACIPFLALGFYLWNVVHSVFKNICEGPSYDKLGVKMTVVA